MPIIVTVDLIEIITIIFLACVVSAITMFAVFYVALPSSAKSLWKNKWLKRGKRCLVNVLNDDNVCGIVVGRPRNWGIKVSRKLMFLVPRSVADLINKRAIMDGFPYYEVSTRTGLATSPEFIHLAGDIVNHKVKIEPENVEDQKPDSCLNEKCPSNTDRNIKLKFKKRTVKGVVSWECDNCGAFYKSITFLNPHVIAGITDQSYDPALIQGIEQDTREEALQEKPNWFIWLMVGLLPYALLTVLNILNAQG